MKKEQLSLDTQVANALVARSTEERWPMHIQLGIPFRSENDNHMVTSPWSMKTISRSAGNWTRPSTEYLT